MAEAFYPVKQYYIYQEDYHELFEDLLLVLRTMNA